MIMITDIYRCYVASGRGGGWSQLFFQLAPIFLINIFSIAFEKAHPTHTFPKPILRAFFYSQKSESSKNYYFIDRFGIKQHGIEY